MDIWPKQQWLRDGHYDSKITSKRFESESREKFDVGLCRGYPGSCAHQDVRELLTLLLDIPVGLLFIDHYYQQLHHRLVAAFDGAIAVGVKDLHFRFLTGKTYAYI